MVGYWWIGFTSLVRQVVDRSSEGKGWLWSPMLEEANPSGNLSHLKK
jgi:hypothetical protein